jgi:hypothetical protein
MERPSGHISLTRLAGLLCGLIHQAGFGVEELNKLYNVFSQR